MTKLAGLFAHFSALLLPLAAPGLVVAADPDAEEPLRVGLIGVDTSHARAFTSLLNAPDAEGELAGFRVVAAYPRGSWDIPSSVTRIPRNTETLREMGLEIVDSVEELVARVDAVLLETNDGRPHLEQALPVLRARKPLFIDKPVTASLADLLALRQLAAHYDATFFTSSSLRYTEGAQAIRGGSIGRVLGADVYSPAALEPTHPDLFWYGIHGVEPLFTVMGTGCQSVVRTHTPDTDVVVGTWDDGRVGIFRGARAGARGYGGTAFGAQRIAPLGDYAGYRPLVVAIAKYFRSGELPVSLDESIEIYAFMAAADESLRRGGERVSLAEVMEGASVHVQDGVVIDAAFPGGNIIVDAVDGQTVRLRQDLRDTSTWWFYWSFRVRGAEGRRVRFAFDGQSPIGVRGPAVSRDHGVTWTWLGADAVDGAAFVYEFGAEDTAVRFAFAPNYTARDLRRFLAEQGESDHLEVATLTRSRRQRAVERVRFGRLDGDAPHRVFLTARHHACETMASFALEGIIAAVLSDTEDGAWLREQVEFLAIPFVDKDGVEEGDQGKNRAPHDHNRDYGEASIYPSVRALRSYVEEWSGGRLRLGLDMHCPYIRGGSGPGSNVEVFFVATADEASAEALGGLSRALGEVQRGPLVHRAEHDMPFGVGWNSRDGGLESASANWMATLEGVRLATTLELPYASAGGEPVTPDAARAFGADLARAIRRWLELGAR